MSEKIDAAVATMIQNLKEKTGKTLEEWIQIASASRLDKHKGIVDHLKQQHGLGHGYANLVALRTLEAAAGTTASEGDLVEAQYSGDKAALRPVYESLIASVQSFGADVELSPKKAYVSIRRNKQFALFQPSTKARMDVGINLKGVAPTGRLEASGSWNSMVSHRVRLETVKDVDKELVGWLRQAYENA